MKKLSLILLAILMAATVLLSACTTPSGAQSGNSGVDNNNTVSDEQKPQINIPNLEKIYTDPITITFGVTFTQNDFDSYPDNVDGKHFVDGDELAVSKEGYLDIMPIIKELADDLSKVGTIEISIVASDVSRWTNTKNNNNINPTYQFHENDRTGSSVKTAKATSTEGNATEISVPLPADATGLIFLPYGFNPEAGKITFEMTICAVITAKYERAYEDSIAILTASDFQCWGEEAEKVPEQMEKILVNIDDDILFDGFLFCGDYDAGSVEDLVETEKGLKGLDDYIDQYILDDDRIYVKGNHDHPDGEGLSPSGPNDAEEYGVFVINESDYMWYNDDEQAVKESAQELVEYLNEKLKEGYEKPIFITSHLPLHYSMRTRQDGDGRYAHYYFDSLNQAAKQGLNIVFLYGHDHSNSWDDYLGGSAVYLTKGDRINISYGKKEEFEEKKLNFTYMNAGFVGYYDLNNEGAHTALTMCVIEITDSTMAISRIGMSGINLLKAKGVTNAYKNESGYDPDVREVTSYQEILLTKVKDKSPLKDVMKEEKIDTNGEPYYKRITDVKDLKDGEKYLFVVQQRGDDSTFVMTPNVVTKSGGSGTRVGFELLTAPNFTESVVISTRLEIREWTLTKSGDGWLLGDGEKYVHMEQTEDTAITATLETEGDVLTFKKNGYKFEISNGEFYLNHNTSRGLVNGYPSEPAYIYIYQYVD